MTLMKFDLNAVVRQVGEYQTNGNWHVFRLYFRKLDSGEIEVAAGNIEHDVEPPTIVARLVEKELS